jgi:uncharacterized membrane protein YpjA
MGRDESLGWRIEAVVARYTSGSLPPERDRPLALSPLPAWLENVAFHLVWVIVAVNLAGTAFGFYYYIPQLEETPIIMWPIVPVSPLATMYIGLSLAAWRLGYRGFLAQVLHVLAFVGCLKYGLWTVVVQSFIEESSTIALWLWQFLIWSHLAMAIEAFLVTRYAKFSLSAVTVGVGWYVFNDLLDYFVPVFDGPHHTWLNVLLADGEQATPSPAFEMVAGSAVGLTVLGTVLSLVAWRVLKATPN